jgi:hypothetical protein
MPVVEEHAESGALEGSGRQDKHLENITLYDDNDQPLDLHQSNSEN